MLSSYRSPCQPLTTVETLPAMFSDNREPFCLSVTSKRAFDAGSPEVRLMSVGMRGTIRMLALPAPLDALVRFWILAISSPCHQKQASIPFWARLLAQIFSSVFLAKTFRAVSTRFSLPFTGICKKVSPIPAPPYPKAFSVLIPEFRERNLVLLYFVVPLQGLRSHALSIATVIGGGSFLLVHRRPA